ncbi:MAG: DUF1365 domain-containing protein [Pseudomonadota bacterium]
MDIKAKIFDAKVMHKRYEPRVNQFAYKIYYLFLPLSKLNCQNLISLININKKGLLSFFTKDHGAKEEKADLNNWIQDILTEYQLSEIVDEVVLTTMPRIFGYVFNPVSFWLCVDKDGALRAVLCEVNNTFGETHSYLCVHDNQRVIQGDDLLQASKIFHVSPFFERDGYYKFKFYYKNDNLSVWIDYYDDFHKKQLSTSVYGKLVPLTKAKIRRLFITRPLITFKVIYLIHYQALKILLKGIKYVKKPVQDPSKITKAG